MKKPWALKKRISILTGAVFLTGWFLMSGSEGIAMEQIKPSKKMMDKKAYTIFQSKCLNCHISVADPEKPGRTRDDWHLVVKVMHRYGLDLSAEESEMIIDLLYRLRKGMEREAG